jgi:hypothetical protein
MNIQTRKRRRACDREMAVHRRIERYGEAEPASLGASRDACREVTMRYEYPRNARRQRASAGNTGERPVTVALEFGPAEDRAVLCGRISDACTATRTLVIALDAWPKRLASSLAMTANNAQRAPLEVMVVDRDLTRRTRVAAAFRAEGCHVVETATSLETIDGLVDARYATDIIAVADTEPESIGVELRDYLDTAHVDALVIAVGDPEWTPSRTRIDATEGQSVLRAGIRSVLLRLIDDRHDQRVSGPAVVRRMIPPAGIV